MHTKRHKRKQAKAKARSIRKKQEKINEKGKIKNKCDNSNLPNTSVIDAGLMMAIFDEQKNRKSYLDEASDCLVGKSVRRILTNLLYETMEERGHFHVDRMGPSGSGILIRFEKKFFLLTAWHVLEDALAIKKDELYDCCFQNESPFWVSTTSSPKLKTMYDFLMPKKIWFISDLIDYSPEGFDLIDCRDFVLVEMFDPMPFNEPDNYLDIEGVEDVFSSGELFKDQALWVSGYPLRLNGFFEGDDVELPDGYTHGTKYQRESCLGVAKFDNNWYISFEPSGLNNEGHEYFNGMSGGAVYNVMDKKENIKLVGMMVSAGNGIGRFIPADFIFKCLHRYRDSRSIIVDPNANRVVSAEEDARAKMFYLGSIGYMFK